MTYSSRKEATTWALICAGINFVVTLFFVPLPVGFDPLMVGILSPLVGLVVGFILYLLRFPAAEAAAYIEYRTLKKEGGQWSNSSAMKKVKTMSTFGVIGAALFLSILLLNAHAWNSHSEPTLFFVPVMPIFGFVSGILVFFFLLSWRYLEATLDFIFHSFFGIFAKVFGGPGRLAKKLFKKWRDHEYRK